MFMNAPFLVFSALEGQNQRAINDDGLTFIYVEIFAFVTTRKRINYPENYEKIYDEQS